MWSVETRTVLFAWGLGPWARLLAGLLLGGDQNNRHLVFSDAGGVCRITATWQVVATSLIVTLFSTITVPSCLIVAGVMRVAGSRSVGNLI